MTHRTIAFVCPPETGHFGRLRPMIAGVVAAGRRAAVFTHARFRDATEACGGAFHDLYGPFPIAEADDESIPWGIRHVAHAARFAEAVADALAQVDPALVVYDGFAVVAPVAARLLDRPTVCVRPGHNLRPERFREQIHRDVAVRISARSEEAAAILRDRYGFADASPFSHLSLGTPDLNLYGEPEEYLAHDVREALEPVACIGSVLPPAAPLPEGPEAPEEPSPFGADTRRPHRAYVSFGTVIWRWYEAEAMRAFRVITRALAARGDTQVLVSLGGYEVDGADLAAEGVRVVAYTDQWRVLAEADLFVTHHGLSSTHEAAYHRVPMLSYPFFWDQPGLAATCAELGLAEPLTPVPRAPITSADVERARARLDARAEERRTRLAEAHAWERRVIANRPAVVRRMLELA